MNERYELAVARIREIVQEVDSPAVFASYFKKEAAFLLLIDELKQKLASGYDAHHPEELKEMNHRLYRDILPEHYQESFADPAYAVSVLGEDYGKLLCFLSARLRAAIPAVFEGKEEETVICFELFLQICGTMAGAGLFTAGDETVRTVRSIREALYWFESDYTDVILPERVRCQTDPSFDFYTNILMNSDLSDQNYLYRYGIYISENELQLSAFLNTLPEEEIVRMASVWTEGYRMGFVYGRKPIEKKRTVELRYPAGFERVVRQAVLQFRKMGLEPTVRRVFGTNPNPQYDYDHREDAALMLDAKYLERRVEVMRSACESYGDLMKVHGGPAVMETFGEVPFEPVSKPQAWAYDAKQQKLHVKLRSAEDRILKEAFVWSERSFTIIAFPTPEIAEPDRFEEIFKEVVKVNTLDVPLYTKIQDAIIDALDRGTSVHIVGRGENRTDLTVRLHELQDPEKETNFENCGADVNIPVGEVFTSPQLTGTDGVLHVSQVYLNGLNFRDLEIRFRNGMTAEISCANFEDPKKSADYIRDNVLFHYDALPMGEFAIGTNTTAYTMARKFEIRARMPILIAEKTGPHFALGDTCYSWEEDTMTYNPNGKAIIARDNEVSALRHTDPEKAYFGCHTDITIPYEELGRIEVIGEQYHAEIIRDGRFVLPGTELLNEALE